MERLKLPTGIENFYDIRTNGYYYVDKTGFIRELLSRGSYVTLFTRPRRFGKTLNMSMLRAFLEKGSDPQIFEGLAIQQEKALCEKYQGQYPVISISLKGVDGQTFEEAVSALRSCIRAEANRHQYLAHSEQLDAVEKADFMDLRTTVDPLEDSLFRLSHLLRRHFGKKVVILIDEYDVPLDKAQQNGYYSKMTTLIRNLFQAALKTNENVQFAVLTGCLRISKESIFTGLNNLSTYTIANDQYDEWFGFTQSETDELLSYYGLQEYADMTKEWYDGYHFGQAAVYCPWDVINWCQYLLDESRKIPQNFWVNTSSNELIRRFAEQSDADTRQQIERLIAGESVWKHIKQDLTYAEIDDDPENLWSILYTTGYLTCKDVRASGEMELVIPNREIQSIFKDKIREWFSAKTTSDTEGLAELMEALAGGDADAMQAYLNDLLMESISFLDGGRQEVKENFYHGMLIGMLKTNRNWHVRSNREAGEGRADIIIEPVKRRRENFAVIIEVKCVSTYETMHTAAQKALKQIQERNYDGYFGMQQPEKLLHYGIVFCRKRCVVLTG